MKTVVHIRNIGNDRQTTGFWTVLNHNGEPESSLCCLELPWLNNERGKSCIPVGDYIAERYSSEAMGDFDEYGEGAYHLRTEGLDEVIGRQAVLVHVANFVKQLLGCVAVGLGFSDLDKNGDVDLVSSRKALEALKQMCGDRFLLKIRDLDPKRVEKNPV